MVADWREKRAHDAVLANFWACVTWQMKADS